VTSISCSGSATAIARRALPVIERGRIDAVEPRQRLAHVAGERGVANRRERVAIRADE